MFKNLPPHARPHLNVPLETRATCSNCVMAQNAWPRDARDAGPFNQALKCCTFEPFLPNFSIGKLLAEGDQTVLENAFKRSVLTPLGLIPRKESAQDFGRDIESRCTFLSADASCTIWRERPSVCRSYFCVSSEGSLGQARWREAERLGNEAEWQLAHEILWEMGFTQDETTTFAEWAGREREFFIECARRAFGLTEDRATP